MQTSELIKLSEAIIALNELASNNTLVGQLNAARDEAVAATRSLGDANAAGRALAAERKQFEQDRAEFNAQAAADKSALAQARATLERDRARHEAAADQLNADRKAFDEQHAAFLQFKKAVGN